jgi:hypothetical protein
MLVVVISIFSEAEGEKKIDGDLSISIFSEQLFQAQ